MSDIEEQTEIAIYEIERKFSSCLLDIEDATKRLEITCKDLDDKALKVSEEHLRIELNMSNKFNEISDRLSNNVVTLVQDSTKEQLKDVNKRFEDINAKMDKILNILNYLKH